MRLLGAIAAALLLAFGAMPAAAQQPRALSFKAGKPYKHKHSGITLPAKMLGLPMDSLKDGSADELDVRVNYEAPGQNEIISIYLYRQVTGALPVWFDRARNAIETRGGAFLGPQPLPGPAAFVPPGRSAASGLAVTYTLAPGGFRSSGLALVPMGGWLVKIRYSSATLTAEELAPRVRQVLASLVWPRKIPVALAATEVADCTTPLALTGNAKEVATEGAAVLMAAMLGNMAADPKRSEKDRDLVAQPPIIWCRDATAVQFGGVYRPEGTTDTYLLAFSDAGVGILVGRDNASALLDRDRVKPSAWSVQMYDMTRLINYPHQDRLPPPEQAMGIMEAGRYISAVTTWGKNTTLEINPDVLK